MKTKKEAKEDFDRITKQLGLVHNFPFEEAWDFVIYRRNQNLLHKPISFFPAKYTKEQYHKGIMQLEKMICKKKGALTGEAITAFNPLKHSFADGCCVREIFNPKDSFIVTKIHKISHPFFLLKGDMTIMMEDGTKRIKAPHYGITPAGTKRVIYTHEDCIFVTIHVTNKTSIKEIEEEAIAKTFDEVDDVLNTKKTEVLL